MTKVDSPPAGTAPSETSEKAGAEVAAGPLPDSGTSEQAAVPVPEPASEGMPVVLRPNEEVSNCDSPPTGTASPEESEQAEADHGRLTRRTLVERLTLFSPSLIEELHKTAQRQLDAEDRRENLLIAKAGSLLGQTGLTITVAGAIFGLIVKEPALFDRLGTLWLAGLALSYVFVFGFGLVAAVYAMRVVLVRGDFEELDEKVVFDLDALRDADLPLASAQPLEQEATTATKVDPDSNATAVTRYRRWMVPHMWSIYQRHNAIHDEKAKLLKRGQVSFTMFVVGITLLVPLVSLALLTHPASK